MKFWNISWVISSERSWDFSLLIFSKLSFLSFCYCDYLEDTFTLVYLQSTTNFLLHKCSIVEKWGSFAFLQKNRSTFFLVIGIFVCSYCSSRLYLGFAKVCMDLLQYQSLNARNLHIFSLRPYSSSRFIFQSHSLMHFQFKNKYIASCLTFL